MNWPNQRCDTWRMRWALNSIRALQRGVTPNRAVLDALRLGCGADVPAPTTDELLEVAQQAIASEGPILEFGSGVTTLLLAALTASRNVEVWTVEPDGARHMRVARILATHGLTVRWCRVLMERAAIAWSDPSLDTLPASFKLLVAVSAEPAGVGGRDRLPPVLRTRLDRAVVVIPATGITPPNERSVAAGLIA